MQAGTIVGKYRVIRLRGSGGMADVYEAEHVEIGTRVALKVAREDVHDDAPRFLNEARAAARIESEHVARVMDVGTIGDRPYLVMELLEGNDLAELVFRRGGRLPVSVTIDAVIQALVGLEAVHATGIVHRDLKPSNLFVCSEHGFPFVIKLFDFGISKIDGCARLTATGAVMGSPAYMSPEQVRNAKHVDRRTDIWSMGVILYELLTGVMPFGDENVGEVFAAILEKRPKKPSAISDWIPTGLDAIVMRCLERDPAKRWSSAGDLARALAPYASEHGRERVPVSTAKTTRAIRVSGKHHFAVLSALVAIGVALASRTTYSSMEIDEPMSVDRASDPPSVMVPLHPIGKWDDDDPRIFARH